MIAWMDRVPSLLTVSLPRNSELMKVNVPIEEAERLIVESMIIDVSNGEACRRFQQALIPIVEQVD